MEKDDDDTHLCLRCGKTIAGLDNYVTHRQQHCLGTQSIQESKEKDLSANVPESCVVAHFSSSPPQSSSWDVPLTASDFFSCLELQSTVNAPRTDSSPSIQNQQLSCSPKMFRSPVLELPSTSSTVNCPPFDDAEDCDQGFFSECETNSSEYYPPRTHTGGKWKPGSRPHLRNRQQWDVHNSQSSVCDVDQNVKSCTEHNLQACMNESMIDSLNFEYHSTVKNSVAASTCGPGSLELQSVASLAYQLNDSLNIFDSSMNSVAEDLNCDYCNETYPSQFRYALHLFSNRHKGHFLNSKDYFAEIFRHENMLFHTMQFQCHVCLFCCNNVENFISHVKSAGHSYSISTQKKLICLPWRFQCGTSEETAKELEECFRNTSNISHPIIISKNKIPFYCNFCVGSCHYIKHGSKKSTQFGAQKRMGYKIKLFSRKKFFRKCSFCTKNFALKDYKKHLRMCGGQTLCEEEHTPETASKKRHLKINHYSADSSDHVAAKGESISDVTFNDGEENVHSIPGTDRLKKKDCLLIERPVSNSESSQLFNDGDTELMDTSPHVKVVPQKKMFVNAGLKLSYKCSKCDFQASKRSLLKRHEETHRVNRPRPFVCEICGSAQLYKWALMQHMRVHSEGKFRCDFVGCQYVCRTQTELLQHQRVHTNERPYPCDLCQYSGKTAHQLKKHQRTHTGEKPFKCKHCSYSASLSHQLSRHMRVHTGSKPYKCPYCDYTCNNQENIRKHILKTKKHQGEKMYPCTFCSFGCNDFPEFQKHLLLVHKEHFPKGVKDIDSSVVAGLYKKDFPRTEPTEVTTAQEI